ncbi:hypothetical protein [Nitriliruptor alkaliphilus]|uniref:hypothetical protein n=1 Tax=Nitriliruptor alkaliphilus TaxID=427918 RepID=UPI0006987D74|nr:hypothetical protein [Nitriliruptor alkaliphilus]
MSDTLFLAVETVIPANHPASILSIPLGLLFFGGSVILLLWSNYGLRKATAMYGCAFFGFSFLLGVFFWFGGPGIPASLGITHLPGQTSSHYNAQWYGFEQGSERASFYPASNDPDSFQDVVAYTGREDLSPERLQADPLHANTVGSVGSAVDVMSNQYLPVDENGIAQIGAETRAALEEDVAALIESEPALQADGVRRAPTFYTADTVGDPRITDDQGVPVATQRFRTMANFVDPDGVPILRTTTDEDGEEIETAWPVGEETDWFAFRDPGAEWFPSMLWTVISLIGFAGSLFWLDRLELRDKRLALELAEEPEDLAVPIAQ